MSYLGNAPARSFISFERQVFTIVNSQTAYALSHSVTNENDIRLVVNNVVQEPGSGKAYTATGTALTLSAALTNGTDEMYCVFLGRATATSAPGAGSIGTAQLADLNVTTGKIAADAVTNAKIADDAISDEQLDPTVITGQTAEATIATDDLILLSDTSASGALRKMTRANFVSGVGATATAEFSAYVSSDITVNNNSNTLMTFQTELFDPDGVYTPGTGKFIAPSDGIYIFGSNIWSYDASEDIKEQRIMLYINGSMKQQVDFIGRTNRLVKQASHISTMLDLDQNDYVQIYMNIVTYDTSAVAIEASGSVYQNNFYGFRLPT